MKNRIKEYAKKVDHQIVGKIVRRRDFEYEIDRTTGEKKHSGYYHFTDEAHNEYVCGPTCGVVIIDAEGGVI